jgi:predicted metal-dependent hydrolase
MKMSKILSLVLVALMTVACLAACATPEQPNENADLAGTYDITMWVSEKEGVTALTQQQIDALRQKAKAVLPQKVAYWAQKMGVAPTGVKITSARTRFGSCSGKNSLCFSWRLMQYPPEAIDYVVVHELAHIRHHDHSPSFWALVERTMPDYRARQALLRD